MPFRVFKPQTDIFSMSFAADGTTAPAAVPISHDDGVHAMDEGDTDYGMAAIKRLRAGKEGAGVGAGQQEVLYSELGQYNPQKARDDKKRQKKLKAAAASMGHHDEDDSDFDFDEANEGVPAQAQHEVQQEWLLLEVASLV